MDKEESKTKNTIKPLRTFQGDVEEAISKNKYSSATIMIAEEERRRENPEKDIRPEKIERKNNIFLTLGGILLFIGIASVAGVYFWKSNQTPNIEEREKTLIGFSSKKDISGDILNRDKLLSEIVSNKKSFSSPPNSVLYLRVGKTDGSMIDTEKILSLLGPNMLPSLSRSFSQYMIGIYSFDTNEPFLVLSSNDFGSSFSGMLKWEKNIVSDIGIIFDIDKNSASSTIGFVDEAIKNKDLRVLKDQSGKTLMLYSFLDKKTLLITKNENIFNAISGRYLISDQIK